jgi:hypothetical protein
MDYAGTCINFVLLWFFLDFSKQVLLAPFVRIYALDLLSYLARRGVFPLTNNSFAFHHTGLLTTDITLPIRLRQVQT